MSISAPRYQPYCRRCHRRAVPRRGMVCGACRKHTGHSSASAGHSHFYASQVLVSSNVRSAPIAAGAPAAPLVTTADLLALRGKSLISCSPREFSIASDLSDRWTDWLNGRGAFAEGGAL